MNEFLLWFLRPLAEFLGVLFLVLVLGLLYGAFMLYVARKR